MKDTEGNEVILPSILKEEKTNKKGLLIGGVLSTTLAFVAPLAIVPGTALIASYFYNNKINKKAKSKEYFNGARNIYINSIDNKVGLSIALFYANKAIELDGENLKAICIKAFILKAMGNIIEVKSTLDLIPDAEEEFREAKHILTALQLKEPECMKSKEEKMVLTEEELKVILREKGFNISKDFLESIQRSKEEENTGDLVGNIIEIEENIIAEKKESVSEIQEDIIEKKEIIGDVKEEAILEECVKVEENNTRENEKVSKLESIDEELANIVKNVLNKNNLDSKILIHKTSKYYDVVDEVKFLRVKLGGKKEYIITAFTSKELKEMGVSLKIEPTPKSESGVSRIIIESTQDIHKIEEVIVRAYKSIRS